jgi:hypothetical protein
VQRFYPTPEDVHDNLPMSDDVFEPPPVPLNSRALVAVLKHRLLEAIETGKASDAKTFVDIIERLAKMAWLDDATPDERHKADRAKRAQMLADIDVRLAAFLAQQDDSRNEDECP